MHPCTEPITDPRWRQERRNQPSTVERDAEPRVNKDLEKDGKKWESFKMPCHLPLINLYLLRTSKVLQVSIFLPHVFISILIACGGTAMISFSEEDL